MTRSIALRGVVLLLGSIALTACSADHEDVASTESAAHAWSYFHWAKSGSELVLPLGDNVSADWKSYLSLVSSDWSQSAVVRTDISTGLGGNNCKAQVGRIEVCSRKYGFNGWLGLAQVWLTAGHIVKATAKMNDSYFVRSSYNHPNAKRHVMCQEVGHALGLDHQYAASCMNDDAGLFDPNYVSPNAHDYQQLLDSYDHVESSVSALSDQADNADDLGDEVARGRHESVFVKELGGGRRRVSWVYWAER